MIYYSCLAKNKNTGELGLLLTTFYLQDALDLIKSLDAIQHKYYPYEELSDFKIGDSYNNEDYFTFYKKEDGYENYKKSSFDLAIKDANWHIAGCPIRNQS